VGDSVATRRWRQALFSELARMARFTSLRANRYGEIIDTQGRFHGTLARVARSRRMVTTPRRARTCRRALYVRHRAAICMRSTTAG
jgi:DNA-binding GntR family transcriptional regulator